MQRYNGQEFRRPHAEESIDFQVQTVMRVFGMFIQLKGILRFGAGEARNAVEAP